MDKSEKERIRSEIRKLGTVANSTMVLSIKPQEHSGKMSELDPSAFATRAAYREALTERHNHGVHATFDEFVSRLQMLGLKTRPAYLSNSVIVEGNVKQLEAALDLPEIDDAVFDFPLETTDIERPPKYRIVE